MIIGELEIWSKDLGEMPWQEAMDATANLGPGWRLPTIEEFKETLYQNKEKLHIIDDVNYWSSTELNSDLAWYYYDEEGFADWDTGFKTDICYVRAVRNYNYCSAAIERLLKDF